MKRPMLAQVAIAVSVAVAVAVVACGESPTASLNQLSVNTAVAPASVRVGEPVQIRTVLRNDGRTDITIAGPNCGTGFEVLRDSAVVAPGPVACALDLLAPRTLTAGDSIVVTMPWFGDTRVRVDMSSTRPLAAGRYTIRGVVVVGADTLRSAVRAVELLP